jgi:hypothetical protein
VGRISVFEPPPSESPSTKPQAPEKFRNRNTKNQAPNTKEIPSSKLQTAALASSLEVLWSLELGVWDLVLLWSLVFGTWSFLPELSASQKLRFAPHGAASKFLFGFPLNWI